LQRFAVGFGVIIVMGEQPAPALTDAQWNEVNQHWLQTQPESYYSSDNSFEVVENLTTPVRGLFVLVIGFALVIGPLNLWLLSRWRKRLWLLWTVPAISLLTCLTVAGYAIFSEGIQGYERVEGFTLLDETTHRATTLGLVGFYSPLTPADGLHFSFATELTPALPYYSRYRASSSRRSLDWTNDQHLSSGWLSARTPHHFRLRKTEARRERLPITRESDGSIRVTNGLGTGIKIIWFADERGRLHSTAPLAAGASAKLTPTENQIDLTDTWSLRYRFHLDWQEVINNAEYKPQELLQANHYLAVLDSALFIEPGLANVRARKARTIVYGIPAQP
jgi:hypothetical protein